MKREAFEELVNENREIEFSFRGARYSVTYYNDNREKYISICRFYRTPIDVSSVGELFKLKIDGIPLEKVINSLPDSAFDIY